MDGTGTFGLDWSKIVTKEQKDLAIETTKEKHPEMYHTLFHTLAQSGLRVCEGAHLKCEDLLPGNRLRVTRRKKRVLKPTVIEIFPSLWNFLKKWCEGKTGYMFPGNAKGCVIERRPKFEEEKCPDCDREILKLSMVRKKCDRVTLFLTHLTQVHGRTPAEVEEWIQFVSKEIREEFCRGGHIHIRSIQSRFALVLADAGLRVRGRGIHTLRHAFAIEMYKNTKDLSKVKQLLGHESIITTQGYATAIDTKETLEKLDGVI